MGKSWLKRLGPAGLAALLIIAASPATAQSRGQGTMLVRQDVHCAGTGNLSSVYLPFSLYFTGFDPNATGSVAAYTQPGGVLVGQRPLTLDPQGNLCVEVEGHAPPGQYKIVYDFGSGTGKQKVIRLVASPAATPSASASHPTITASPTQTSASPTDTTASPTDTTASPTATTASPSPSISASPSGSGPDFVFIPETLPATGASLAALPTGLALLVLGLLLMLLARANVARARSRRH